MVAVLWLVRGSPAEQSEEVVGVFLSALDEGDDETAFGLLCEEVRADLEAGEVPAEYQGANPGRVVGSTETEVDGAPVVEVEVRWADGSRTRLAVVSQDGPRVCGTPADG
jgi:hypothetical protein